MKKAALFTFVILLIVEFLVFRNDAATDLFFPYILKEHRALEKKIDGRVEPVDLLVIGSSLSKQGVNPEILARELGLPEGSVFNYSFAIGKPGSIALALRRSEKKLRSVKYVLYFPHEFQFSRHWTSTVDGIEMTPETWFYSYEKAKRNRTPEPVFEYTYRTYGLGPVAGAYISERLKMIIRGDTTDPFVGEVDLSKYCQEKLGPELITNWGEEFNFTYQWDGAEAEVTDSLIALLNEWGIKPIVMSFPQRPELESYIKEKFPQAAKDYGAYFDKKAAEGTIIYYPDFFSDFKVSDNRMYTDYAHLNCEAGNQLTEYLADGLRENGIIK